MLSHYSLYFLEASSLSLRTPAWERMFFSQFTHIIEQQERLSRPTAGGLINCTKDRASSRAIFYMYTENKQS